METEKEEKQSPKFRNSYWLGLFDYVKQTDGSWPLRFNWPRIITLGVTVVLTFYFGVTTFHYSKYRRAEVESVSYSDMMMYLFSRDVRIRCRRAMGDKLIEKALKAKDPASVIGGIRAGLNLAPTNPDGLIYYSYLLFYQRMYHVACVNLASGLKDAADHSEYANYFIRRALACTEDDVLIKAVDEALPVYEEKIERYKKEYEAAGKALEAAGGLGAPENDDLAKAAAAAKKRYETCLANKMILQVGLVQSLILRGYFDEANARLESFNIKNMTTGEVLYAQILWETGDRQKAIEFLDKACERSNNNLQVIVLRAMYLMEMGEELRARTSLLKTAVQTDEPDIRIRIITMLDKAETQDVWKRLVDSFITSCTSGDHHNQAALLALSQYATDYNKYELSDRIYKIAERNVYEELPRFELHHIESMIARGEAQKALDAIDELGRQNLGWVEKNSATFDSLRTMAYYKMGDEMSGKLALDKTIKNRTATAAQLLIVGKRLSEMNRLEESRIAYDAAYLTENYNQQALLVLVDYAVKKQDVEALFRYLPELLATRRPPRSMLERVRDFLASDRMLFKQKTDEYLLLVEDLLESKLTKEDNSLDTPVVLPN
ncbi:MAG: hypothetical protein K6B46_06700 [Opitutales bacterium]|nr:hypothetical protein [Opitutales bacterium]